MPDGLSAAVEVRPLPSLEEFARFLFDRDGANEKTARHAQRNLLRQYAGIWANYEGTPNYEAQRQADDLFDECTDDGERASGGARPMIESIKVAEAQTRAGSSPQLNVTAYESGWLGVEQGDQVLALEPIQLIAIIKFAEKHKLIKTEMTLGGAL